MALSIIVINQRTTSTLIFTFPVGPLSLFCAFYLAALFDQTTRSIADPARPLLLLYYIPSLFLALSPSPAASLRLKFHSLLIPGCI